MKKTAAISALFLSAALLFSACGEANGARNGITVTKSKSDTAPIVGDISCIFPLSDNTAAMNIMITQYGDINPTDVYVWKKTRK